MRNYIARLWERGDLLVVDHQQVDVVVQIRDRADLIT